MLGSLKAKAADARKKASESGIANIVRESSERLVKGVVDANQTRLIQKRAKFVREILCNFDWVKYNVAFFRSRRSDRDGLFAVPKEAWESITGRRRRILKKIEQNGGSTSGVKFGERVRGAIGGAALGTVATCAIAGAVGVVAAPVAIGVGAAGGAMAMSSRSAKRADAVLQSMKGNEKDMAEAFEGMISSLAYRYMISEDNYDDTLPQLQSGYFEKEWGMLGADTISSSFGGLTLWASSDGIRVRLKATCVQITQGRHVVTKLFCIPSVVDFLILTELGNLPPKDVETVVAMLAFLSSPRGYKVASHISDRSKQLMVSVFGGETVTFNAHNGNNDQQYKNLVINAGCLKTIERADDGRFVAREAIQGDCVMPLPEGSVFFV